jgi:hypothetical protein
MTDWNDIEHEALDPLARELADLRERHHADPTLDQLRAARAGALPDEIQDSIAAHLESSAWSRALVEGADDVSEPLDAATTDRLLSRIRQQAHTAERPLGRRRSWAAVLAVGSIAAVLVVAVFVWRRSAPARQESPAAAVSPVFALQLTKPDVKLTPAALLVRGEGRGQFVDDVAAGLNAYRAGDYATAARELENVQPKYPGSIEIPFYLGVSRLFLNDAVAAVRALESARALNEPTFADDVEWYLAVANERAGSTAQSRTLLEGLCNRKGAHASDACAAMTNRR